MNYSLQKNTEESIKATETAWKRDLSHSTDIFPGDVWRIIKLLQENSDYTNKKAASLAYGIYAEDKVADAVVEIIVSQSGKKWIKMLDCYIRPSISERAFRKDTVSIEKLIRIYAAAIVGALMLADEHKASLVKVYGRTETLLYILTSVASTINDQNIELGVKAVVEGRWLVVKPVKIKREKEK